MSGTKTTGAAILAALSSQAEKEWRRSVRLGASSIGEQCERRLWMQFRWCEPKDAPDGRLFRLFRRGHLEEDALAKDLEAAGITILTVDTETMKQYELGAGHFVCKIDGIARGVPEAPKHWCVVEMKTMNEKSFKKLVKDGVEKSNAKHYWQMQAGMHFSGDHDSRMKKALYVAVNKNDDSIYTEVLDYVPAMGKLIEEKIARVVDVPTPPARAGTRTSAVCRFCPMIDVCHSGKAPPVSCRNCVHSTPEADGAWSCAKHKKALSLDDQLAACDQHLYIAGVLDSWADDIEVDRDGNAVLYRIKESGQEFWNGSGENARSSEDIARLGALVADETVKAIEVAFNATPVEPGKRVTLPDSFFEKGGDDIPF